MPEANDTLWKSVSGGVRVALPDESDLQARLFLDFGAESDREVRRHTQL